MGRPKQTTLKGRGFTTGDTITTSIMKSLSTDGPGPGTANVLKTLGWNGKVVGSVVLSLSNDNSSVCKGQFSLVGEFLSDPIILPAKKLWPNVSDTISLSINLSSPNMFSFPDSLVSDYVNESETQHLFFWNNAATNSALSDADLIDQEIGSFCLRMFVYPSSCTFAAFSILIFPDSAEGLKDHALAMNPKWPGLLLSDGKIPLSPASTTLKLKWGSPILPLVIPGASLDLVPEIPSTAELLYKLSSVLRSAVLPESKRIGESLLIRWEALDSEGAGALDSALPPTVWPEPPCPPLSSGRVFSSALPPPTSIPYLSPFYFSF